MIMLPQPCSCSDFASFSAPSFYLAVCIFLLLLFGTTLCPFKPKCCWHFAGCDGLARIRIRIRIRFGNLARCCWYRGHAHAANKRCQSVLNRLELILKGPLTGQNGPASNHPRYNGADYSCLSCPMDLPLPTVQTAPRPAPIGCPWHPAPSSGRIACLRPNGEAMLLSLTIYVNCRRGTIFKFFAFTHHLSPASRRLSSPLMRRLSGVSPWRKGYFLGGSKST